MLYWIIRSSIGSIARSIPPIFVYSFWSVLLYGLVVLSHLAIWLQTISYFPYDLVNTVGFLLLPHYLDLPIFLSYLEGRRFVPGRLLWYDRDEWHWGCVRRGRAAGDQCWIERLIGSQWGLGALLKAFVRVQTRGWCLRSWSCVLWATRWPDSRGSPSIWPDIDPFRPELASSG